MRIYIAGLHSFKWLQKYLKPGMYFLDSFYYLKEVNWVSEYYDMFGSFLLDSGAFTFMEETETVNWDRYLEEYVKYIKKWNIDLFFEVDIESLVGMDKVLQMRTDLEQAVGRQCIPVWHPRRGLERYKQLCRDYDYVAIGGMAQQSKRKYREWIEQEIPWFVKVAHQHNAKIHALGYATISGLKRWNLDSIDTTSWVGSRYGQVWNFTGRGMIKESRDKERISSAKQVNKHNFQEWLKFQKYAEHNY